jgi:hypothetical protein
MARRTSTTKSNPVNARKQTVLAIREQLVSLHGALIIAEQATYEAVNGPVESVESLLDLLQNNPWFTWLLPISDLLVRIDHLLEDEAFDITDENVTHLTQEIDHLFNPSKDGDGFGRAYYEALQRAPDVVLAHYRVRRSLPEAA